ncbi:caspase-2-like isoform X2 [Watersipora subatra]|uniref:caspase-2-like isoform X2 n=1 Tax=Watersipora subatra TaxID=2589382 RepID=UPI00355C3BEE
MAAKVYTPGMESLESRTIQNHFSVLTAKLQCKEMFLSYFFERHILITEAIEEILAKTTSAGKNTLLLRKIMMSGRDAFYVLYDALVATRQYDLADLIIPSKAPSKPGGNAPIQEFDRYSQAGTGRSQPPGQKQPP